MVRRNQNEADRRRAWDSNARYFQRNEVTATKQRAWGSESSFQDRYALCLVECFPKILNTFYVY